MSARPDFVCEGRTRKGATERREIRTGPLRERKAAALSAARDMVKLGCTRVTVYAWNPALKRYVVVATVT